MTDREDWFARAQIDRLAASVRGEYCRQRRAAGLTRTGRDSNYGAGALPRYDGGVDADGKVYKTCVWAKIARFALAHGLDPTILVAARFAEWRGLGFPAPTAFYSDAAVADYRKHCAAAPDRVRVERAVQEQNFLTRAAWLREYEGLSKAASLEAALRNPDISMAPLYRYCAAAAGGLADVVEAYRGAALVEYVSRRPAYDEYWADLIPAALRRDADIVRASARSLES